MNERIMKVRKALKLTQKEFGEALGVGRDVIANIENGRVPPRDTFVKLLCSTYHVSYDYLNDGSGNMFQQDSESIIDRMADEYKLTRRECSVITAFLDLSSADRAAVMRYVDNLVTQLAEPAPTASEDATLAGIAAMQDYARMVADEKEAEEKSSTSAG